MVLGQDINPNTIAFGGEVCARVVYLVNHVTLFSSNNFDLEGLIDQFKLLFLILYLVTLLLILFLRLCCNSGNRTSGAWPLSLRWSRVELGSNLILVISGVISLKLILLRTLTITLYP